MDPWYAITLLGEPAAYIVLVPLLAASYFLFGKRLDGRKREFFREAVFVYSASVLLTIGVVLLVKSVVFVERPCILCIASVADCNPYCIADGSFPSGHSATIFAVFSAAFIMVRKKWFIPLFIVPALVAASRYTLGVHRVVDVVAGGAIGLAVPLLMYLFYEKESRKYLRRFVS